MGTRIELHEKLSEIDELHGHLYFQPPVSLTLKYPCLVYDLDDEGVLRADNLVYHRKRHYTLTVIDKDPDSDIPEIVGELFQVKMDRHFENDHLHHFVYSIYF